MEIAGRNFLTCSTAEVRLVQVIGDKIFAMGGHDHLEGHQTVEVFENETWILEPLQVSKPHHSFGITSWENTIIFGGGTTAHHGISDAVFQFDPRQRQLNTLVAMPTRRAHIRMVTIQEYIFCIGGYSETYLNEVLKLDMREEKWTQMEPMQSPRSAPGAVVVDDKIVVIGGTTSHSYVTETTEEYSPHSNTWVYVDYLPSPRSDLAVVAV